MKEKFARLIEMCKNGVELTNDNVGEGMFLADRGTFKLVIPTDNPDEHGDFFVYSIKGHDCYSANKVSTHVYHIIDGTGVFITVENGEEKMKEVKPGDTVVIPPNTEFTYKGNMIITFEMTPNWKQENEVPGRRVEYDTAVRQ